MSVDETGDPQEHLGKRAASGFLWLAAQKWAVRVSGFATLVVLTHQISPHDFGVVAAAMTVIPIVYLLADLGFSTYLLQTDDIDEESLSTAFWTSVAAAVVLSSGIVGRRPADGEGIPHRRARPGAAGAGPRGRRRSRRRALALLRRNMVFRAVAMQAPRRGPARPGRGRLLALRGDGVWALVAQLIVTQWVIAILAWRRLAWLPSLRLSPPRLRQMAVFGVRVSTVDLVATLRIWAEGWIVTVALGPAALGLLNIGQRLVLVAQELVAPRWFRLDGRLRPRARRGRPAAYDVPQGARRRVRRGLSHDDPDRGHCPGADPLLFGDKWTGPCGPRRRLRSPASSPSGRCWTTDSSTVSGGGHVARYAVVVDGATVATTAFAVRWGLTGWPWASWSSPSSPPSPAGSSSRACWVGASSRWHARSSAWHPSPRSRWSSGRLARGAPGPPAGRHARGRRRHDRGVRPSAASAGSPDHQRRPRHPAGAGPLCRPGRSAARPGTRAPRLTDDTCGSPTRADRGLRPSRTAPRERTLDACRPTRTSRTRGCPHPSCSTTSRSAGRADARRATLRRSASGRAGATAQPLGVVCGGHGAHGLQPGLVRGPPATGR